jgi:hypothetical protein
MNTSKTSNCALFFNGQVWKRLTQIDWHCDLHCILVDVMYSLCARSWPTVNRMVSRQDGLRELMQTRRAQFYLSPADFHGDATRWVLLAGFPHSGLFR